MWMAYTLVLQPYGRFSSMTSVIELCASGAEIGTLIISIIASLTQTSASSSASMAAIGLLIAELLLLFVVELVRFLVLACTLAGHAAPKVQRQRVRRSSVAGAAR